MLELKLIIGNNRGLDDYLYLSVYSLLTLYQLFYTQHHTDRGQFLKPLDKY